MGRKEKELIVALKKASNKNLQRARTNKKDEFYTQLTDIEKELWHYREYFKGKVIFCNCDDPEESNFWNYFALNFEFFGLKKLISTHFEMDKPSYKLEITSDINNDGKINKADTIKTVLKQNGDFRSPECIKLLKKADIIVTNPPFSLFREYISQLIKYDKKFIIIGNLNAITYKETFKLIKNKQLWLGASIHSGDREFRVPDDYPLKAAGYRIDSEGKKYIRIKGVRWFTNLDYQERHEDLILYKTYYGNENKYPTYDNYDAINVDKTKEIPIDYEGVIGVPITFMDKYSPDQFEIIGLGNGRDNFTPNKDYVEPYQITKNDTKKKGNAINRVLTIEVSEKPIGRTYYIDNNNKYLIAPYARILIKNKKNSQLKKK